MKPDPDADSPTANSRGPARPHDRSRRLLFTHRRMIEDLLRGFVHESWVKDLDFDTLNKLSTDFVSDGLEERISDVVWEVRFGDGPLYVLVLLEFQSRPERFMARRLVNYVMLFYERLQKVRPLKPGELLPPVLPIVLYNGEERWTAPLDMSELITPVSPELARYQPSMRYLLIDELRWSESGSAGLRNAVATFFKLQQCDSDEMRDLVLQEAGLDWLEEEQAALLRDILEWMSLVLLPQRQPQVPVPKFKSLNELKSYMEKDMETWSDILLAKGEARGMAKGKAEGKAEGRAMVMLSLLEKKFGAVDEAVASRIRTADAERHLQWAERILTAQRLEDVFKNGSN